MVIQNENSPDPANQARESSVTMVASQLGTLNVASSDSDEEEISHEGYELLALDANTAVSDEDSESDSDASTIPFESSPSTSFQENTKPEVYELWNSKDERPVGIEMDTVREEQVLGAMAGFTLPSSAIPPWAVNVPEAEWKQLLTDKISSLLSKP